MRIVNTKYFLALSFWLVLFFLAIHIEAKSSTSLLARESAREANANLNRRIVYINYAINKIVGIDYVDELFELDFYLQAWWKVDSLLLKRKLKEDNIRLQNNLAIDPKYLDWFPENDFTNAKSIQSSRKDIAYIYRSGYVLSDMRYIGVFYNDMHLKKFPFDNQNLRIILEDFNKTTKELVYKYGSPFTKEQEFRDTVVINSKEAFETNLQFTEFTLNEHIKFVVADHLYEFTADKDVYSQAQLILNISRETGYYFTKIILITLLIVIMSWCVFFIKADEIGSRAAFSVASFLALVGHNYVSNSILPRIPYLTILDYITLGASFLVFLSAVENLVVYLVYKSNLTRIERNQNLKVKEANIDYIAMLLFPLSLVMLVVYVYILAI